MSIILRLILAHLRRNKMRVILTLTAVAVAVTGVGFSLKSLKLNHRQAVEASREHGRFHAVVVPAEMGSNELEPALLSAIGRDPAVAEVDSGHRAWIKVIRPKLPARGPWSGAQILGSNAAKPPQALASGRWLDPATKADEAVIASTFQKRSGLKLGDELVVAGAGDGRALKVVGTVAIEERRGRGWRMPSPHVADIWVSRPMAAAITGLPEDCPGAVFMVLKSEDETAAFVDRWKDRVENADPPAVLRSVIQDPTGFLGGKTSEMSQMLLATSTFLWTLTAGFVVFLSLSIGVRTRLRQLAILRTLAMSRRQAVALVLAEALALTVMGWVLGILLLIVFLTAGASLGNRISWFASEVFAGIWPGGVVLAVSGCCALLGSLLAALPPAWQIIRMRPMAILGGRGVGQSEHPRHWMTLLGIACIIINPVLIVLGHHESVRDILRIIQDGRGFGVPLTGSILMIVGFALVTPAVVRLSQRLFNPASARVLCLDALLLRQQLGSNLWRTAGTTVALSAGLALYVASLVWGFSMLVPFTPTEALPRMQVAIKPSGLPVESLPELLSLPGVNARTCLTVAVEHPRLSSGTLARPGFAHVHKHQQHVLIMGVDPARAFATEDPLFRLDFLAGDPSGLARRLKTEHACIIPDHFATQCHLAVGDTFAVEVPEGHGAEITYTVAAIADVPGWNWLTKFSATRERAVRALALVFVDERQARADYGLDRIEHLWLEVNEAELVAAAPTDLSAAGGGRSKDRAGKRSTHSSGARQPPGKGGNRKKSGPPKRGGRPPMSKSAAAKALLAVIDPIARRHAGEPRNGLEVGEAVSVTVTDRNDVMRLLRWRGNSVIWSLTILPLIMLAISSLAVLNTILASVRSRNWQFGILRGVGMTCGQLIRLILGECLQLWLAASMLSVLAGIALAWCGTRLCSLFFFFAGRTPPLVIPWGGVALGLSVGLLVCLLAGLVPALSAGLRQPLHFIQRGRLSA